MATPAYTNGFGGNVIFDEFEFGVVEWALKSENGLIDVTNTASSNWGQYISGMNQGSVSIKAFWDTANLYTAADANLEPGVSGTATLKIGATGKSVVATLIIMSCNLVNSPTAGVQYDIEGKLTSAPTFPT